VDKVVRVVPVLIKQGRFPHPWLGIEEMGYEITPGLARMLNLPTQSGILIAQFYRGSPADQAGIRGAQNETIMGNRRYLVGGDILTAIDGVPLKKWDDLNAYLEEKAAVGQQVALTIVRNSKEQTLSVTLADTPESVQGQ
jgi:S1-C subfamily serine protease